MQVAAPHWAKATVMEKADFLQEGAQGLLRALRLFDTTRGVRFATYARAERGTAPDTTEIT